jgi:hypothetical protein
MHDSMMMADVGFMLKVSGSRIATPLAPPKPGNTPIKTPSRMPTNIRPILTGEFRSRVQGLSNRGSREG